ncbi:phosphodiester glycosidase family protein [Actinokineospora sp. HUAS TT18]|uniref:phosphodiester glycosidase family protein n=1 Tax=Actinokineospora sp. HUAS TT18 TaxID=3447451 RepID=UPI003F528B2D
MRRLNAALAALTVTATVLTGTGAAATTGFPALPLGASDLPEQRSVRRLAPGVELHSIVRGRVDARDVFTVSAGFGVTGLEAIEQKVRAAGFEPRRERAGTAGWVVRVGRFATLAQADALLPALRAAGLSPRTDNTLDDGVATDGPWRVNLLVVDPARFGGEVRGVLANDAVAGRETTSAMAERAGALAAVNGGYFTIDGTRDVPGPWLEGTDGDPAGISVIDGEVLSESVGDRPALVLRNDRAQVRRLRTDLELVGPSRVQVTGLNRTPGLVVNCGGVGTLPAAHDYTCGNPDEVVVFSPAFGAALPTGPGYQVELDRAGRVIAVGTRGGANPAPGHQVVQATGTAAEGLQRTATVGTRWTTRERVVDTETGTPLPLTKRTTVINGGPLLVDDGEIALDPARDGWSPEPIAGSARAEFFWRWYERRNPRTAAGVLPDGRLVLMQCDGRAPGWSAGLSIAETAQVMAGLGVRSAVNLDGGGSSTAVANGQIVNRPSDTAGERPAGDAIVLVP